MVTHQTEPTMGGCASCRTLPGQDHTFGCAVVWILMSTFIISLVFSGHAPNYVSTWWLPILVFTACLVFLVSACAVGDFLIRRDRRHKQPTDQENEGMAEAGKMGLDAIPDVSGNVSGGMKTDTASSSVESGHKRFQWTTGAVLIPALLVIAVAPGALGSTMLYNATLGGVASGGPHISATGSATVGAKFQGGIDDTPLSATSVNELTLEQLLDRFTLADPEQMRGKQIRFVGFVSHYIQPDAYGDIGAAPKPGQAVATFSVNRFKVFCCAADAIAYSALIISDKDLPDNQWVEVVGTVDVDNSLNAPFIVPTSIKKVPQPEVPYL